MAATQVSKTVLECSLGLFIPSFIYYGSSYAPRGLLDPRNTRRTKLIKLSVNKPYDIEILSLQTQTGTPMTNAKALNSLSCKGHFDLRSWVQISAEVLIGNLTFFLVHFSIHC